MAKKFYGKRGCYYRLTLDFVVMGAHPQPLDRDILTDGVMTLRGVHPETIIDGKFDTNYCRGSLKYIPFRVRKHKKDQLN